MTTVSLIIGLFMLIDGLFTLFNFDLVQSKVKNIFPNLDLKKVAIVECVFGAGIVLTSLLAKRGV